MSGFFMTCIFCALDRPTIAENAHAVAVGDGFAVSPGHALIIPKRHATTIFDLTEAEYVGCFKLVKVVKALLEELHHPDGFNVGVNSGEAAGQTVMHAHIHVIPRYKGDVENPRGGVRHILPGKGFY
jgi:diadenosine tetraphosphate (Ap4A) HIT family hydrolase